MSKHTPGPWTYSDEYIDADSGEYSEPIVWAGEKHVAIVRVGLEGTQSNTRLIAAAPELLQACKVALDSLRAFNEMSVPQEMREAVKRSYEHSPEIRGLIAAVNKAEGGS